MGRVVVGVWCETGWRDGNENVRFGRSRNDSHLPLDIVGSLSFLITTQDECSRGSS